MSAALLSATIIAGCGGGRTTSLPTLSTPTPVATATPIAYSAHIVQITGDVTKPKSFSRRALDLSTATPAPIIVTQPDPYDYKSGLFDTSATARVDVLPSPSATPSSAPTWTTPSTDVSLTPIQNAPANDNRITVTATDNMTVNSSITASVVPVPGASPVAQTAALLSLQRLSLGCAPQTYLDAIGAAAVEYQGGVSITSGAITSTTLSNADVAVKGPTCGADASGNPAATNAGTYNDKTLAVNTLFFPHGGNFITDGRNITDLHASDWTGTVSTVTLPTVSAAQPNAVYVFKTGAGEVYASYVNLTQPGSGDSKNLGRITGPFIKLT